MTCSECINFDETKAICKITNISVTQGTSSDLCYFRNVEHFAVGAAVGRGFDSLSKALLQLKQVISNATDSIIKTFGNVEYLALSTYPDGRIVELALHSKKARTRKKNIKRIMNYYYKHRNEGG